MPPDQQMRLMYFITSLGIGSAEIGLVRLVDSLADAHAPIDVIVVLDAIEYLAAQLPETVSVVDLRISRPKNLYRLSRFW
jgi:hypothetical protein